MNEKLVSMRYSPSTQRTYASMFRGFLSCTYPLPLHQVSRQHIIQYHTQLIHLKNISKTSQDLIRIRVSML
ncbi:phage integrase N-terminal SAM-like domain-containing protein [Ekhidna sp.]